MGKLRASQVLMKVADGCLQMYGGLGYMNEMLLSRYYRDARGLAIGGGADEIMREVITRRKAFEPISKMHLTLKGCVAIRFKMLTYKKVSPLARCPFAG